MSPILTPDTDYIKTRLLNNKELSEITDNETLLKTQVSLNDPFMNICSN